MFRSLSPSFHARLSSAAIVAFMLAAALPLTACGGGGAAGGAGATVVDGPGATTPPTTPATPPTTTPPSNGTPATPPADGGAGTPPPGGPTQPPIPGPAAGPLTLATLDDVRALASNSADGSFYAVDGLGQLWRKSQSEEAPVPVYGLGAVNVEGLAYDAQNGMLYLSLGGSQLARFRLDTLTLTGVGAFPGYGAVKGLEYDTLTSQLYGVDAATRTLLVIDPTSAAVTAVGGFPAAYSDVQGLAMDPVERRLYAADQATRRLLEIDPNDATVAERAQLPRAAVAGLAHVRLDGVQGDRFLVSDTATGEIVLWDAKGHDIQLGSMKGLDYDAAGRRLLGVHQGQAMLTAIDPDTGWKTWVGWIGVGGIESLAVDAASQLGYGVDNGRDVLVRINLVTGQGTDVGPLTGALASGADLSGLAFDVQQGQLYGVNAATGGLVRIDPASGTTVAVASLGFSGVRSLAFEPARRVLHAFDDAQRMHLTVDLATLAVAQEPVPQFGPVGGLAFDADLGVLFGTDLATGSLVRVWQEPTAPSLGFNDVRAMVAMGAQFLAHDQETDALVSVDPATGAGSLLVNLGAFDVEALAVEPGTGRVLVSDVRSGTLLAVDPVTGTTSLVGVLSFTDVRGLAFDPASGVLYGVDRASQSLVAINPADATCTLRMDLSVHGLTDLQDLAFDPHTQRLVAIDAAQRRLVEIDPAGMTLVELGLIEALDVRALLVEAPGVIAAIDRDQDRLVRLDRFTGATLP